jgi:hypothetical protein
MSQLKKIAAKMTQKILLYAKNDHSISFQERLSFFAENWRKSAKTLTLGHFLLVKTV